MRIIKYVFLLLVLVFIAISVFVATEKGNFDISKTIFVKSPRNIVFNYVNDYTNWQDWLAWTDTDTNYKYTNITAGKGAFFSWDGSKSDGASRTISTKENDSIHQQTEMDGIISETFWTFKDSADGTKVTWRVIGKLGFMPKIYAALKGGAKKVIGGKYEESLAALDKTINREINTYHIKVDGLSEKTGNYYLHQTITSTIENMPKNIRVMLSKLVYFFKKNQIKMSGKPFISYDYFDTGKGITRFSVCIPVRDEVHISPGSDIQSGKFFSFSAVKTTLKGDYSHLHEAWDKTFDYIKKNNLEETQGGSYIEVYKNWKDDVKNPSKWVTEIYIPVNHIAVTPSSSLPTVTLPKPAIPRLQAPADEISIP